MASRRQPALFEPELAYPEGFRYEREFLSAADELDLKGRVANLQFGESRMRGVTARRRVAQFGWRYSFESFRLTPGDRPPDFLVHLQHRVEAFAGLPAGALSEILVTEYTPGATIGWHRDAPPFDVVVGISLGASCRFRFRRRLGSRWETMAIEMAPRSIYVLDGPARREWEHSIPAIKALRYSITFRSLKQR